MKKGFGLYNDWPPYFATPPSNLSAFAAPFSVNHHRTTPTTHGGDVSAPIMDSSDAVTPNPIHFPANYRHGYDFFSDPIRELDSPSPYGYSGLQVLESSSAQFPHLGGFAASNKDQYSDCTQQHPPSVVEAQPYFTSYAIHDHHTSPDHWSSSSRGDYAENLHGLGFTGQSFAEFNPGGKGKQVALGSSFSSNQANVSGSVIEEGMNQGCQELKDSSHGEFPHTTGWEKHSVPTSADQLDDKSCWWGTMKPMPVEFSGAPVMQSSPLSLETHHEAPLKLDVDSGNHHFSYTGVYDIHSRQHDKPARVDTVCTTPITGPVTDLNVGNIVADGDLGHNNFYNLKEAYPMKSPGTAGCFGLGHLHMHLERNEPSSSNNAMISDRNVSSDHVDYIFKARHGSQNPHPILDKLSLRLSAIGDVNSVEKSFECGDQRNPAVDSPCWKGAPTAHFTHYESSEAFPPQHVHKNEECFGSVIQEPQNFLLDTESNVKKSCYKSNSCQMHIGIVDQEKKSAGSPRKFSETKFASEDCKSDGAVNVGPFQSEPNCDYGLQYLADITEMKENSIPPTKPVDCESGSSHNEHQVIEENKLVSQKLHTLCIGDAAAGCNENKCLESGTFRTAQHALSLPSSVEGCPLPIGAGVLVNMMQNWSEFLIQCLQDGCELKEQDCNILRNVIHNLNTCLFHQPEMSRHAGETCELQQNVHFKRPHSTKIGPESSKVEPENPLVLEANLHSGSGKPHSKLSDSISPRGYAEMTEAEKMTKALKNILSENFHDDEATESQAELFKNLWLEAEAALCSVNYKARYSQMKMEMEKHSYKQRDVEEQSKFEVIPSLSKSQSSATEVHNYRNPDSSAQDLPVSYAASPKEQFQLKFSTDMNQPNPLTPEEEGSQELDNLFQNYTVSGTNKEAAGNDESGQDLVSFLQNYAGSGANKEATGNDEASVMARYHVLTARDDKPCIDTIDLEEPSDTADKSAPREIDIQNQVNFCQDPPVPGKNMADYEASVLARFHFLKFRDEDPIFPSSEGKWLDGVRFSGKGIEDTVITKDASSESKSNSYTAGDKSVPKETHLGVEDNQEIQPPNYHSDGFASDWEHV